MFDYNAKEQSINIVYEEDGGTLEIGVLKYRSPNMIWLVGDNKVAIELVAKAKAWR